MSQPALSWPAVLASALTSPDIGRTATAWAMEQIMEGAASPVQIAGLVVALRARGETPDEVIGLVETMLAHATPVDVPMPAVDTCGTGGDRAHTVNISTMAALVTAAAGASVAKHGNRAASSSSGSADVLEQLGVVIDLGPAAAAACLAEVGICFFFAPLYHPALRHAAVARRELGVATVFNFLGPLANPGRPAAQAVGVPDARLAAVMAQVLAARGTSALVFRGEGGLDELSISGPSQVWVVRQGQVHRTEVEPQELGIARSPISALRGGDAPHNAAVVREVLTGAAGPIRDAVLLNAAAALVAFDGVGSDESAAQAADSLVADLHHGMERARDALASGAAARRLDRWASVSADLAAR